MRRGTGLVEASAAAVRLFFPLDLEDEEEDADFFDDDDDDDDDDEEEEEPPSSEEEEEEEEEAFSPEEEEEESSCITSCPSWSLTGAGGASAASIIGPQYLINL